MGEIASPSQRTLGRLNEHLQTLNFSLETVQMALAAQSRGHHSSKNLNARQHSGTAEDRDAARVAIESLEMASSEFGDLVAFFDSDEGAYVGLIVGFWSTLEWCWERLCTETAHSTSPTVLHHELAEARRRIADLQTRVGAYYQPATNFH